MEQNQIQEIRYLVGEAWKGAYNSATVYGNANVVQDPTGLSVYRSLKPGNANHDLSDTTWWFKIIDLSSIKEIRDQMVQDDNTVAENELQRIQNEQGRVSAEQSRVNAETRRIEAEQQRESRESQRIQNEQTRQNKEQQREQAEQIRVTAENGRVAAEQQRVQSEQSRVSAEEQRALAENDRVAVFAEDHATAVADHTQAVSDHERADADHTTAAGDHTTAAADHTLAGTDHTTAASDHTQAAADHTLAGTDHTKAASDHTQATSDHTTAASDHTTAAADHTRAESDHATAVEDHATLGGRVEFLEQGLGKYSNTRSITLQQATAGKYVNVNGQEVNESGYGISEEVQLNAGDIMLVPSASAVPAAVSLFARIVTRTYQKVINYAYTYRQDYPELPATATADYDQTLVYTAVYDTSGETPVLTGWTRGGQTYTTLPATHEVTESYYEPLMKQAVAAMPSTGYYVYLCPTAMTIVVSGYTATVNGGVALVVGLGIFKNIATNFIGAPGQSVLAQAFAGIFGLIDGLVENVKHMGSFKATEIDCEYIPKVCGFPLIVEGDGAPSIVPRFVGQKYLDKTNKKEYTAFAVTNSTGDWTLLN